MTTPNGNLCVGVRQFQLEDMEWVRQVLAYEGHSFELGSSQWMDDIRFRQFQLE